VRLTGGRFADATTSRVAVGVLLGLVVGKPAGVMLAGSLAVRTRVGALPAGTTWGQFGGAAAVAGIGFTVSLFVADLSFDDAALLSAAKAGILAASVLAGTIGFLVLSQTARHRHP
jgi:Na+/H+ antiporter NhaA